jgi:hypothetical protein
MLCNYVEAPIQDHHHYKLLPPLLNSAKFLKITIRPLLNFHDGIRVQALLEWVEGEKGGVCTP